MSKLPPVTAFACCLCLPLLWGCGSDAGPEMATVSGVVKLDGQPLPGASVTFVPVAGEGQNPGSMSVGTTDADGWYELQYSSSTSGSVVGTHTVRITTYRAADEDEDGNETPPAPEKVPVEYNVGAAGNPEMKREVKPGSNEINFDLKSGGEVFQPPSDDDE